VLSDTTIVGSKGWLGLAATHLRRSTGSALCGSALNYLSKKYRQRGNQIGFNLFQLRFQAKVKL
jgi:hypothetical protein